MILDKNGKLAANVSQPLVVFEAEEDYNAWLASLPDPALESFFLVVKAYQRGPGVMEFSGEESLSTLPKYANTIYVNTVDDALWRYDSTNDAFKKLTSGGAS